MNTSALKTFAPAVRRQLIEAITRKLDYVLTARTPELLSTYAPQVAALNKLAGSDRTGLIERVAYTWFNRLAALRYLDAKGWHPFRARVLTPATPDETQPEILKLVRSGTLPDELAPFIDSERMNRLLDGVLPSTDPQGEVYRLLVLAACRFYHDLLPDLFEKLDDETELLLPDDLLTEHSIVQGFRTEITDEDCAEVEILGWLYQFYISEKKDTVMARKKAVPTEDIPAVTQLFTPHWIVRYLVENSLGRLWLLNRPTSHLREHMPYYIEGEKEVDSGQCIVDSKTHHSPATIQTDFLKINKPEEIRLCDPACGSGHMLTYSFDLLFKIYAEEGYAPSEIPGLILRHNLYGLEICPRAAQLAQFALVCKAREKSRRFFQPEQTVQPAIIELEDVHFDEGELPMEWLEEGVREQGTGTSKDTNPCSLPPVPCSLTDILHDLNLFTDAKNFGSLLQPKLSEQQLTFLKQRVTDGWPQTLDPLLTHNVRERVLRVIAQAEALTQRYHVVVANPPYMGSGQMDAPLLSFCEKNYALGYADLFSCFIERLRTLTKHSGLSGLITMQGWLFQPSFIALRRRVFEERCMTLCLHLGAAAFDTISGEVVKTTAFIIKPGVSTKTCQFFDLTTPRGESKKEQAFLHSLKEGYESPIIISLDTNLLLRIPGAPAFYKNSETMVEVFESSPSLGSLAALKAGLTTGDNVVFQRFWHEVANSNIAYNCTSLNESENRAERWYPCSSGGNFRKWYRKSPELVDWQHNGSRIRVFTNSVGKLKSRPQNTQYYFRRGFTWNKLSSSNFAVRLQELNWIYDDTSRCGFPHAEADFDRLFAFLCSTVSQFILGLLNPSMSFTSGDLARLPMINLGSRDYVTAEAINIARTDWDNFETSWDFRDHPLLRSDQQEVASDQRIVDSGQWIVDSKSSAGDRKLITNHSPLATSSPLPTTHYPLDTTLNASWLNWKVYCDAAIRRMQELETENNRLFIAAYGLEDELSPEVPEEQITLARADARKDMAAFLSYAVGCMMGRYSLDKPGLILADAGDTLAHYFAKVGEEVDRGEWIVDSGEGVDSGEEVESHNTNRKDTDESSKLSAVDCLAKGDGSCRTGVCGNENVSQRGTLRINQPSETGSGLDSIKHCGGAGTKIDSGVSKFLIDCSRFKSRDGNPNHACPAFELCEQLHSEGNTVPLRGSSSATQWLEQQPEIAPTTHCPLSTIHFVPDSDGILPVLDGDWFEDDITSRTREFLSVTFGDDTLRENIRFLEESLGKDLRKYFLSDFYKDHLQTYKKRPIYWLVQSPKKGFSVLIYLHRYTRDTLNIVLNRYLRPYQEKLRERISHMTQMQADDSASTRDKTAARKEADNLLKILHECEEWERETLLPLAQQRIELDLDDGVKVNYLKLYEALAPIPGLATKEKD